MSARESGSATHSGQSSNAIRYHQPDPAFAPLELHSLDGNHDWQVPIHKDLLAWLNANVKSPHALRELVVCYQAFLKGGSFTINKPRFAHGFGSQAGKHLKVALESCPYIASLKRAKPRRNSEVFTFRLRAIEQLPDSTDSRCPGARRCTVPPGYSRILRIPCDWLRRRCLRWAAWCEKHGHELKLDLHGLTRLGRATFKALSLISVPTSDNFCEAIDNTLRNASRMTKRVYAKWFHSQLLNGGFLRSMMSKDGRSYHPLTNCPKALRRLLHLAGEPLREADLGSSYWYLLATQLPVSDERDRLMEAICRGAFYEGLSDASGVSYADDTERKAETQRQCLFGRDWREASRPLWAGLRQLFPGLCGLISELRRSYGVSGFACYLMRLEGKLMDAAHLRLIDDGIHAIRLHDGLLVGQSHVSHAADVIRETGLAVFGIEPRVKAK